TSPSTAANCGVRWWMRGNDIAASTSGGTGVGPGARRYDLITARCDLGGLHRKPGPRRTARRSLSTPPWLIPRERQSCDELKTPCSRPLLALSRQAGGPVPRWPLATGLV